MCLANYIDSINRVITDYESVIERNTSTCFCEAIENQSCCLPEANLTSFGTQCFRNLEHFIAIWTMTIPPFKCIKFNFQLRNISNDDKVYYEHHSERHFIQNPADQRSIPARVQNSGNKSIAVSVVFSRLSKFSPWPLFSFTFNLTPQSCNCP